MRQPLLMGDLQHACWGSGMEQWVMWWVQSRR